MYKSRSSSAVCDHLEHISVPGIYCRGPHADAHCYISSTIAVKHCLLLRSFETAGGLTAPVSWFGEPVRSFPAFADESIVHGSGGCRDHQPLLKLRISLFQSGKLFSLFLHASLLPRHVPQLLSLFSCLHYIAFDLFTTSLYTREARQTPKHSPCGDARRGKNKKAFPLRGRRHGTCRGG